MDRACEDDETRQLAADLGFMPVVPPKSSRTAPGNTTGNSTGDAMGSNACSGGSRASAGCSHASTGWMSCSPDSSSSRSSSMHCVELTRPSSFGHSSLQSGKRHTLEIKADNTPYARICFRTGYAGNDINTFFSGSGSIGGTSGCFALGGGAAAIRACFCGARNAAGKWARTDAGDGYEYMLDAATRTNRGCTTN